MSVTGISRLLGGSGIYADGTLANRLVALLLFPIEAGAAELVRRYARPGQRILDAAMRAFDEHALALLFEKVHRCRVLEMSLGPHDVRHSTFKGWRLGHKIWASIRQLPAPPVSSDGSAAPRDGMAFEPWRSMSLSAYRRGK